MAERLNEECGWLIDAPTNLQLTQLQEVAHQELQSTIMMKGQLFDHLSDALGTLVVIMDPSGLNELLVERLWNHWLWELTKISFDQVRNNMWLINTKVNITHIFITALPQPCQSLLVGGSAVQAVGIQVGIVLDTEHNFLATSHKEQWGESIVPGGKLRAQTQTKDRGYQEATDVFG